MDTQTDGGAQMYRPGLTSRRPMRALGLGCCAALTLGCTVGADVALASPGAVVEFSSGLNSGDSLVSLAPGQSGNMWFTVDGSSPAIGEISPSGKITMYTAGLNAGSN